MVGVLIVAAVFALVPSCWELTRRWRCSEGVVPFQDMGDSPCLTNRRAVYRCGACSLAAVVISHTVLLVGCVWWLSLQVKPSQETQSRVGHVILAIISALAVTLAAFEVHAFTTKRWTHTVSLDTFSTSTSTVAEHGGDDGGSHRDDSPGHALSWKMSSFTNISQPAIVGAGAGRCSCNQNCSLPNSCQLSLSDLQQLRSRLKTWKPLFEQSYPPDCYSERMAAPEVRSAFQRGLSSNEFISRSISKGCQSDAFSSRSMSNEGPRFRSEESKSAVRGSFSEVPALANKYSIGNARARRNSQVSEASAMSDISSEAKSRSSKRSSGFG